MDSPSHRSPLAPGVWPAAGAAAPGTPCDRSAELERRLAALEGSNARLADYAHFAAHDLKEPLATIALFLGALREGHADALDARGLRLLQGLDEGLARMRDTVDRTLLDAEDGAREHARVDMNRAVDQALRALDARRRETGAIVRVNSLPEVIGDPGELGRLLQNLIGNALKFSAVSRRPRIWLSARSVDGVASFSVRDNGTGLRPGRASRVFEPFERADPADPRSGSGLGLTIARRIVADHGGEISIRSASGGGTEVSFTLACAEPELQPSTPEQQAS